MQHHLRDMIYSTVIFSIRLSFSLFFARHVASQINAPVLITR